MNVEKNLPNQNHKETLLNKIKNHSAVVSIVGLGYVGLPLAIEIGKKGFKVRGVENNPNRCSQINAGKNYIIDVADKDLSQLVEKGLVQASTTFEPLTDADVILICVPTPLNKNKEPDVSYIVNVVHQIVTHFKPGKLIVLESTTYPGTTEELILAELVKKGWKVGRDFFLAFSPERVDPGNRTYGTSNTAKIIGGVTSDCLEITHSFYSQFIQTLVQVSSPRVAEMTKLFENIYRSVNIALVNELAQLCSRMDINAYEVISAADTKPYGFQAFWPGPGVGGHCIPLDPYYLAWKGREYDFHARFIQLAGEINEDMPRYVVAKAAEILNLQGRSVNRSKILQLGIAYKKDIDDYRESPALGVYEQLTQAGAQVTVCDPHVSEFYIHAHDFTYGNSGPAVHTHTLDSKLIREADLVMIVTDHGSFDYEAIFKEASFILDCRNALGFRKMKAEKVFHLSSQVVLEKKGRGNLV